MADISQEVEAFRNAKKGRDVRGSLISLAEKVNAEVEENTSDIAAAITEANTAADNANQKAVLAETATTNANTAAVNAAETRQDLLNRLANGEFKGEKGDTGNTGPQGQSGVSIPPSSRMYVYTDDANNSAIHCVYDDALYDAPPIKYNDVTGAMYWTYDNGQ